MTICKKAESTFELEGILQLQRQNLKPALSDAERKSQGFVTVVHSLENLLQLNSIEKHIIAKANDQVVAYILAMTPASETVIPVLRPMFALFREISFAGKNISSYNYIVVGQVCIDKAFRGSGLLDACYTEYRNSFQQRYDFAITEIAANNQRSLQAHHRIGFREVHRYVAPDAQEWAIVIWDWNQLKENRSV